MAVFPGGPQLSFDPRPGQAAALPATLVLLALLLGGSLAQGAVQLPPGFRLELYAEVPGARHLTVDERGTVWVGTMGKAVYAIPDANRDFKADRVVKVLDGLNGPNGVAVQGDDVYVAEVDRIRRYPALARTLGVPPNPVLVRNLPPERHHGYRVLRFGPDGLLYVSLGAPTNAGEVEDPYGTLARLKSDGQGFEILARGIRNSMGFDWHPVSRELYFTDNGRDMLGDDLPPEELNRLTRVGQHFGFPYRFGNNQKDPEWGNRAPAGLTFTPAAVLMEAHVAPLGMRFYRGSMFPAAYKNQAFIAQHGSWNRSTPLGYRVVTVQGSRATVFAHGWLQGRRVSGRPVDLQELSDGSVLVSDDYAGKVYRITYRR